MEAGVVREDRGRSGTGASQLRALDEGKGTGTGGNKPQKGEKGDSMNKLTIIGNLTADPELRTTSNGVLVCSFTVAVRRRKRIEGQPEADFFSVSAWRERADLCAKYLKKASKVCVVGPVTVRTWESNGKHGASLEVTADEIEFLSPRVSDPVTPAEAPAPAVDKASGMEVVDTDDLPFD